MATKADLTDLSLEEKRRITRLLDADLRERELSKVAQYDNKDDAWLDRRVQRQMAAFEENSIFVRQDKDGDKPDSSRNRFIQAAEKSATELTAQEVMFAEALLRTSGYSDIVLDGKLSDEENKYRQELGTKLANGQSAFGLRSEFQANAATTAAEAQAQAQITAEHVQLVNQGLGVLGYPPSALTDTFTADNQDWLQRNSQGIFGTDRPLDIHKIDQRMKDNPQAAAQAVGYAIKEGDYREQVASALQSGNKNQITQAQTILKFSGADIDVTGKYNAATARAAKDYIETPKGLSDKTNYAYTKEIGGYSLEVNIKSGGIPIPKVSDNMPDDLKQIIQDLDGLPLEEQAQEFSNYLVVPENFKNYDEYLKGEYSADLTQKYAAQFDADAERLAKEEPTQSKQDRENLVKLSENAEADKDQSTAEQAALSDSLEGDVGFNTLYNYVDSVEQNENEPSSVTELRGLQENIATAENALISYKQFPLPLNKENGVVGNVGAPYAPIITKLENNILEAGNKFTTAYVEMDTGTRQTAIAYLEKNSPIYAQQNQPPAGTKPDDVITKEVTGTGSWFKEKLSSLFGKEANAAEATKDAVNAPAPKVSGLDLGPMP